jgi:hypothetical protein
LSATLRNRLARREAERRRPPVLPLILVTAAGQPIADALAEQPAVAATWRDGDARLPRLVIE